MHVDKDVQKVIFNISLLHPITNILLSPFGLFVRALNNVEITLYHAFTSLWMI